MDFGFAGGGTGTALPSGLVALAPSGDVTGTKDTAAVKAAIAGFPGGLGAVLLGPGTWYGQPGNPIVLNQGQSVQGLAGSAATFWNAAGSGTGPMFTLVNSGAFTGGQYAGPVSGLSMIGFGGSAGAIAMSMSGLQGARVRDLYIAGFAGGGLDFTNALGSYAEQGSWKDIVLVQNGSSSGWNVLFSNSSFDYCTYEFTFVALANTDGIRLQNGAQLSGCRLQTMGNFYGAAGSNSGAVIAIDRGNAAGTSYIINTTLHCAVESAGSGVGHQTLLQGSSNAASQFTGVGVFSFNPVGPAFQGYTTGGASFSFAGIINEPAIGTTTPGVDGLMVYGQTITNDLTVNGNGDLASGNPAIIMQGTSQVWQFFCDNGTDNWGVYDQTHGKLGLTLGPNTELLTEYGGTDTAQSVPAIVPLFANGTASQLSDTTRDYMVYLECTTAGTALVVKIGPTSVPAISLITASTATLGELVSFRLPAGWYAEWSATAAAFANQNAIGC
jgi:hypothetical protein